MLAPEQVASLYESQLHIPLIKPEPQFYIVTVGLIGSGKTTVIKPLSEKLHLLRISGDEIRKVIQDKGGDETDTLEVGRMLVEKYAQAGYSIAHDTDRRYAQNSGEH